MRSSFKTSLLVFCLLSHMGLSAKLPRGLSPDELNTLIKVLSFGSASRVMRSAEAYPAFPGLKLSIETPLIHSGELAELGNGSASLPTIIPSPRISIIKGLGMGFEFSLNLSNQDVTRTMGTFGILGKWTYLEEKEAFFSSAVFASYSELSGFDDSFKGNQFEAGILASKDYVRIKPYVGFGMLIANATVSKNICAARQDGSALTPHLFVGTEIELPMNITFQFDLTQAVPSASLSLGYHF